MPQTFTLQGPVAGSRVYSYDAFQAEDGKSEVPGGTVRLVYLATSFEDEPTIVRVDEQSLMVLARGGLGAEATIQAHPVAKQGRIQYQLDRIVTLVNVDGESVVAA